MQNNNGESKKKPAVLSVVKYMFAALLFGSMVFMVVAIYISAR